MTATAPTNGEYLADVLRQEYALRQPKMHIPLGIGAFLALSAISAIPALPFAGAALIGLDAFKRLKKNRKIISDSYRDMDVLFQHLKPAEKDAVLAFSAVYPLDKAIGTKNEKKTLPRSKESQKNQRAKTGAGKSRGHQETVEPIDGTASQTAGSKSLSENLTNDLTEDLWDVWQPEDLPEPFVNYLAAQIHLLITATTGSGKTWLLRCLCTYLANRGDLLVIADPKGTQWGELTPARLLMRTGIDYLSLLKDLDAELNKRIERLSKGEPVGPHLWAVFDEWMLLKGKCQTLDADGKTSIEQRLLNLIAAGRELNMHLIMVNQSHLLGDLSLGSSKNTFSSGLRDNLCTLGLGCKTTQDNAGKPMKGNSKSIDSMLRDRCLVSSKADREAAEQYHAELRRHPALNRTFVLYASQLFIGPVPELSIPDVFKLTPFYPAP